MNIGCYSCSIPLSSPSKRVTLLLADLPEKVLKPNRLGRLSPLPSVIEGA